MSCFVKLAVGFRLGAIAAAALTIVGTCGFADAQVVRPPGGTGNPSHGNGPGSGLSGRFGSGNLSDGNAPRPFASPGQNGVGRGVNGNRFSNGNGRGFGFNDRGDHYRRGGRFNRGAGFAVLGGLGLGYGLGSSGYYNNGYDGPYGYGSNFDGIGPGSSFGTTFYGPGTVAALPPDDSFPEGATVAGLPVDDGDVGQLGQSCRTPRKICELRSEAPVGGGCSCRGKGQARSRGIVVE